MTDAEKILKMIEEVSPDDTAKLDEIDARVWCWINNCKLKAWESWGPNMLAVFYEGGQCAYKMPSRISRSRDALKAIRPDGWKLLSSCYEPYYGYQVTIGSCGSQNLPTEELAELHAIIQAISYERENQ